MYNDDVSLFPGNLAVLCASLVLGTGNSVAAAMHFLPLHSSMTCCSVCISFVFNPFVLFVILSLITRMR